MFPLLLLSCALVTMPADTVPAADWSAPQTVQTEAFEVQIAANWRARDTTEHASRAGGFWEVRDNGHCWLEALRRPGVDPETAIATFRKEHIEQVSIAPDDLPVNIVVLRENGGTVTYAGLAWSQIRLDTRFDTWLRASHLNQHRLLARPWGDGAMLLAETCWPATLERSGLPAPSLLEELEARFRFVDSPAP